MRLVEQTDYEGNDSFWYLDEFDLYSIFDSQIMDRVIQKKWSGKYDLNASIADYSTSYTLLKDKHQIFASDRVFTELKLQVLTLDWSDMTHPYKFNVWIHSMDLRQRIDLIFTIIFSVCFQFFMNGFNTNFH